jgi:hypothetical protein
VLDFAKMLATTLLSASCWLKRYHRKLLRDFSKREGEGEILSSGSMVLKCSHRRHGRR